MKSWFNGENILNPYFSGNSFATLNTEINNNTCNMSQSLFQWKLLCNADKKKKDKDLKSVTILILVETPLQHKYGV